MNSAKVMSSDCESKTEKYNSKLVHTVVSNNPNGGACDKVSPVAPTGGGHWFNQAEKAKVISSPDISDKARIQTQKIESE